MAESAAASDAHRGHEPGSAGILAGLIPSPRPAGKDAGAPRAVHREPTPPKSDVSRGHKPSSSSPTPHPNPLSEDSNLAAWPVRTRGRCARLQNGRTVHRAPTGPNTHSERCHMTRNQLGRVVGPQNFARDQIIVWTES